MHYVVCYIYCVAVCESCVLIILFGHDLGVCPPALWRQVLI